MNLRLYDWGPSPFCLKVRALLDYKGLAYERVNVLGKPIIDMWRRGTGKVPALEIDGELVCDSTDIAFAVDHLGPSIIPDDPRERAMCHAVEEWADESIYFVGLWYQWVDPPGAAMVHRAFGKGAFGVLSHQVYKRHIARQIRGQGTGRKSREHIAADLERHLEAVEALVAGRYAIGGSPTLADFALLGQLVYLKRTPGGGAAIDRRPEIDAYLERCRMLRGTAVKRPA